MDTCMTPEQAREKAEDLFQSGYNCSQSVIGALCGELGADFDTTVRLAQPFGGGMGRMREVCGTVSGMLMALGMASGSSDASDKQAKDGEYALVQQLAAEFRKKNGSIVCRELLGLVPLGQSERELKGEASVPGTVPVSGLTDPVSFERTAEYYKKRPCRQLCGDAAEIFQSWYLSYGKTEEEK
ncbi:MAG: C-GCAxxG-C-C family protein [Treponema sp.]|nr:C-GCAxxG-C-C family protein [Treponema sp.]